MKNETSVFTKEVWRDLGQVEEAEVGACRYLSGREA